MKHTPELSGAGQIHPCANCELMPSIEGHDGCLGTLTSNEHSGIMNACCGHGDKRMAYIQYWDGHSIQGIDALNEQLRLLCKLNENP